MNYYIDNESFMPIQTHGVYSEDSHTLISADEYKELYLAYIKFTEIGKHLSSKY